MQTTRLLPLLRHSVHGGNRRPSGRLRDPAGPGAPMGALVADPAAPFVRRPAAAARAFLAGDPHVIAGFLVKRAGFKLSRADTGVVTLIRRFGSAANLNVHLHCLVLDGIYLNRDGVPVFHEAAAPSTAGAQREVAPSNRSRSGRACRRALDRSRLCPGRHPAHELGPAAQTSLRHRRGALPELRRRLEDHRRHRRSAADCQNPQPSGPADPRPAALPGSSSRSIPDNLSSRKPLANASRQRRSL